MLLLESMFVPRLGGEPLDRRSQALTLSRARLNLARLVRKRRTIPKTVSAADGKGAL
jgi:hypothetical protein